MKDEIFFGGIDVSGRINQYNPNGPSGNGQSLQRDRKDVIAMHDGGNLPVGWDACPYPSIDTGATGIDNTCVGNDAGNGDTKGSGNTLLGADAGAINTTSSNNTLLGYQSGRYNSSGNNTFVGTQAGEYNYAGTPNTCVGYQAWLGPSRGQLDHGSVYCSISSSTRKPSASPNKYAKALPLAAGKDRDLRRQTRRRCSNKIR